MSFIKLSLLAVMLCAYLGRTNVIAGESARAEDFTATSDVPHEAIILDRGLSALELRLLMIERARKSIEVEYFIYDTDPSARLFTQALIRKAHEGVKVRVLLDYFLIKPEIDPFIVKVLEQQGIEVKFYNTASMLRLVKYQYRTHRKLLAVDGQEAITGGRNIADEYFDLKKDFNFVDKDLYIKGPIVEKIVSTFEAFWNHSLSVKIKTPKIPEINDLKYSSGLGPVDEFKDMTTANEFSQPAWGDDIGHYDRILGRGIRGFEKDFDKWEKKLRRAVDFVTENDQDRDLLQKIHLVGGQLLDAESIGTCNKVTFTADAPGWGRKSRKGKFLPRMIYKLISQAKKHVTIDSPYFITESDSRKALKQAFKNKAKVTLLTNSLYSTDAIYVNAVLNSILGYWLKKGLDAYIFQGSLPEGYITLNEEIHGARWGTHVKSYIFDDDSFVVGTFNFDPRSSRYNSEMAILCENSPELTQKMQAEFNLKLTRAHHIKNRKDLNKYKFNQIGVGKGILYYLMKPFALLFRGLL